MQSTKIPEIDIKKYGGRQVAVVDGKIVAHGTSLREVIKKTRNRAPSKALNEIHILSIPKSLSVVYYA